MNKLYKMLLGDISKLPQYGETRTPYQTELNYFQNNPQVAGMAAEDNKVILNPYSANTPEQQNYVRNNEGVRLFLRENPKYINNFSLTSEQQNTFGNYSPDINDQRSTILARLLTGDSSVGNPTLSQVLNARKVLKGMKNNE